MKTFKSILSSIPLLGLLGGVCVSGAECLIVDQTYDPPPPMGPLGWGDETVVSVSRQFVKEGIGGSTAAQMSATLVDGSYVTLMLFQSGVMGGNDLATRDNTVVTFDIKIDKPGMQYIGAHFDAFPDYLWDFGAPYGAPLFSYAVIPLGAYKPGVFQKIALPLNSPLWFEGDWPQFDPAAKTYNNITLQVEAAALPGEGERSITITVDNLRVSTKNDWIPFVGAGTGVLGLNPDGSGYLSTEYGTGEHIGAYKSTIALPWDSPVGTTELTTASGDKLSGSFIFAGADAGVQFLEGTGRFKGVAGGFRSAITWNADMTGWTSVFRGSLNTRGSK